MSLGNSRKLGVCFSIYPDILHLSIGELAFIEIIDMKNFLPFIYEDFCCFYLIFALYMMTLNELGISSRDGLHAIYA